jgi:hypothetical protein
MPGGERGQTDAALANVFQKIRAIAQLSEMDMARRLGTGVDVVLNFEAGAVDALPAWPETARLVERYAALGGVDPAPILTRLLNLQTLPVAPPPTASLALLRDAEVMGRASSTTESPALPRTVVPPIELRTAPAPRPPAQQMGMAAPLAGQPLNSYAAPLATVQPVTTEVPVGFVARSKLHTGATDAPVRTRPPAAGERDAALTAAAQSRRRRRLIKTLLATSPLTFFLLVVILVQTVPGPVYAVTRALPGLIGTSTRGLVDMIVLQTAVFKDGLRWIDAADPRQRKGHRLGGS